MNKNRNPDPETPLGALEFSSSPDPESGYGDALTKKPKMKGKSVLGPLNLLQDFHTVRKSAF